MKKSKRLQIAIVSIILITLILLTCIPNYINGNVSFITRIINAFSDIEVATYDYEIYGYNEDKDIYYLLLNIEDTEGIYQIKDYKKDNIIYTGGKNKIIIDYQIEDFSDNRYDIELTNGTTKKVNFHFERTRYGKDTYKKVNGVYANTPNLTGFNPDNTSYMKYNSDGTIEKANLISGSEPTNWYNYTDVKIDSTQDPPTNVQDPKWANICVENNGATGYFVWIPRFCYKFPENNTAGNERVDIKFIDVFNNYNSDDEGILTWDELKAFGYKVPEAFEFGTYKESSLSGFWISKYELSNHVTDSNTTILQANTDSPVAYQRNTWMSIIRNMEGNGNLFGLNETYQGNLKFEGNSNNIDVHMQKNTEYGAMALLSASQYGKPDKIQNGETTTGNDTGVVIPYRAEWTAAQATETYGRTGYDDRYINYYSANAYERKRGDAFLECTNWHYSSYQYMPLTHVKYRSWSRPRLYC